jgi:hypothetical protein
VDSEKGIQTVELKVILINEKLFGQAILQIDQNLQSRKVCCLLKINNKITKAFTVDDLLEIYTSLVDNRACHMILM